MAEKLIEDIKIKSKLRIFMFVRPFNLFANVAMNSNLARGAIARCHKR